MAFTASGPQPFVDRASFFGYLNTVEDAMILVEAANQGLIQRLSRRLQSEEQGSIRSGAIFIFDENETNMKRWTDKLMWSPSRQIGSFFVYRQVTTKIPRGTSVKDIMAISLAARGGVELPPVDPAVQASEREYVGSLVSGQQYSRDGLVKKTIAVGYDHVVSYFKLDDVQRGELQAPSSCAEFTDLKVSKELQQTFSAHSPHASTPSEEGQRSYSPEAPLGSPIFQGPLVGPTYGSLPLRPEPSLAGWNPQMVEIEQSFALPAKPSRSQSVPTANMFEWKFQERPPLPSTSSAYLVPTAVNQYASQPQLIPSPLGSLHLQPVPQSLDRSRRQSAYDLRAGQIMMERDNLQRNRQEAHSTNVNIYGRTHEHVHPHQHYSASYEEPPYLRHYNESNSPQQHLPSGAVGFSSASPYRHHAPLPRYERPPVPQWPVAAGPSLHVQPPQASLASIQPSAFNTSQSVDFHAQSRAIRPQPIYPYSPADEHTSQQYINTHNQQ